LGQRNGLNPAGHGDLVAEIKAFLATGIDGLFSDNVSEAVTAAR
jgi:glycerophosphoryl diester phosphodiesterase